MSKYVIALDQGTTSSRAVLFDHYGDIKGIAQKEFTQYFPKSGWVEHDPVEIWESQKGVLLEVLRKNEVKANQVGAIGITNQRETTLLWDRETGEPVYPAIVWQDKRTAAICEKLKKAGLEKTVKQKTGLIIDAYFSATKVMWMLENVEGLREKAKQGKICFGTVDSWLVWKLSNGEKHLTDYTNAARTMLFNIETLSWDKELLEHFDIPASILPQVQASASHFADLQLEGHSIPIAGIAGDQHAALFGQACFEPGTAKNTYGTGCFMLMNTGSKIHYSDHGLLTTIAWGLDDKVEYALEGSIFIAGAAIQWLRDGLKILDSAPDSEYFALKAQNSDDVYVVPAFAGLGAPYWDMYARGAIFGLTRDTGKNHIIKATLESLAFQTRDVLEAMESDSGLQLKTLKVDGGAAANDMLMQFQADILGSAVERPEVIESTAMGAAYLAAITTGLWKKEDISNKRKIDKVFKPNMPEADRSRRYEAWKKAVNRTMGWLS